MSSADQILYETGVVTQVIGDIAWVNTQAQLACSSCKVESTCGNGILEKYLAGKIFISKLPNTLQAKVGDEVVITIPKNRVTQASFMVYFVPLISLILGALLGDYWFNNEPMSIISSFTGLAIGLSIIRFYSQIIEQNKQYIPQMLKVNQMKKKLPEQSFNAIKIVHLK